MSNGFLPFNFLLFGVDCISVGVNAAILSKLGNVNLIQEFIKVVKVFWTFFAIKVAHVITIYFAFNDINTALDMKMDFEWITTNGRLMFIYHSTDLSDHEKALLLSNITFT